MLQHALCRSLDPFSGANLHGSLHCPIFTTTGTGITYTKAHVHCSHSSNCTVSILPNGSALKPSYHCSPETLRFIFHELLILALEYALKRHVFVNTCSYY